MATLKSKPVLGKIITGFLQAVTEKEKTRIINRWSTVRKITPERRSKNWYLFLLISSLLILFFLIGGSLIILRLSRHESNPLSGKLLTGITIFFLLLLLTISSIVFLDTPSPFIEGSNLNLTPTEKEWLKNNRNDVTIDAGYNLPPVAFFEGRNYLGIAVDYIDLLSNKLGITIRPVLVSNYRDAKEKMKKGEIKILGGMQKAEMLSHHFLFTEPYLSSPVAILQRKSDAPLSSLEELTGKKVSLPASFFLISAIKQSYPKITIDLCDSYRDTLLKVSQKQSDAAVLNQIIADNLIEKESIPNLAISGKTPFTHHLSFAVPKSNPILFSILSKAMNAVTPDEHEEIRQRWLSLKSPSLIYEKNFIHYLLIFSIFIFLTILIIISWNIILRKKVHEQTRILKEELAEKKILKRNSPRAAVNTVTYSEKPPWESSTMTWACAYSSSMMI